jgi:sulfatase maturation enzyme AslB (radical SAM superfamily)
MSGEVIRRHTYGEPHAGEGGGFIGVAARTPGRNRAALEDCIAVVDAASMYEGGWDLRSFGAVLTNVSSEELASRFVGVGKMPAIVKAEYVEHISDGDVLGLDFRKGYVRSLYRIGSSFNTIFATDQCNSNCLMCSQPPKDVDDSGIVAEHLRLIRLIPATTESLGITGGEPTLLGEGLFAVLTECKHRLPLTRLHMLTNGRTFAHMPTVRKLAAIQHPNLTLGIPLYSDVASHHDYVVQANGAFDQTMLGFHNLATHSVRIEIRVVLHRQTYKRLPKLARFIYRNVPFAEHI